MIAGIDLSTKNVEIVRRVDGDAEADWRRVPIVVDNDLKERDALCARYLQEAFPRGAFWDGVWLCGVEYPFAGGKAGFMSIGLKTVMGAIMALIPPRVTVIPLPANFWQARFLGRRGKSYGEDPMPRRSEERKPLIKSRALVLMRDELLDPHWSAIESTWEQDAYDAFGISWVVEGYNEGAAWAR